MFESIKPHHIWKRLPSLVAAACAFFMLACVPLVFRNALFDINRIKVDVILAAAPVFALACALSFVIKRGRPALCTEAAVPCALLLCFALAAVISAARQGFDSSVLLGADGRQCGLYFLLSCVCVFFVIAVGGIKGNRIAACACVAASVVAVLGALNAVGIDPLGFYARMQKGQEHLFLSTIGNIDFFGCYLALMLPIAAGGCIHAASRHEACFYLLLSVCIMLGVAASRSDSAMLAVQLGMLVLLVLSGESWAQMAKVLFLWALSFSALPVMYSRFLTVRFFLPLSGIFLALCQKPFAWAAFFLLCALSGLCCLAHAKHRGGPGVRRLALASAAALAAAAALLLGAMVYFTVYAPDAELGALSSFLRFDDHWGTRRGFVYRRCLRAFVGFSSMDRLFGQGVDRTRHILAPYFDDPAMLVYGTFNDAHCQVLQYLLTTGLIGAGSLAAFHVIMLVGLTRSSRRETRMSGFCAALYAYTPIALLNVSQPILIASYLSVCAVAVSGMQHLAAKEANP